MRALTGLVLVLWAAAACGEQGVAPQARIAAADSADQVLEGMTTTILADGVRRSVVSADTAYIYQNRQVAELRTLRASFFDLQGNHTSTLTADRGTYGIEGGTLEAWGNVEVVSMDGTNRRLRTGHLIYDRVQNQIRSDSAFTYESPGGVISGNSFYSDPDFRNVVARQPRGRERGSGMLLPGQ